MCIIVFKVGIDDTVVFKSWKNLQIHGDTIEGMNPNKILDIKGKFDYRTVLLMKEFVKSKHEESYNM